MPSALPIESLKAAFISAINVNNTLIVSAEPGAGKSTRLPLWLLDKELAINGKIYLLQPRRVAVKTIALFLAKQRGEAVGQTIGYRLRDESKVSDITRLEVVTEGILIQIMQSDPEMADTSIIILDEFHERSLQADLAFAMARDIQQSLNEKLTLVLMSATLATEQLQLALPESCKLSSEGRSYPIEVSYQAAKDIRQWRGHCTKVIKQTLANHAGSILVFLPGSGDIRAIYQQLAELADEQLLICPLYGDLSLAEQQQAIAPCHENQRKVVLATNIAETSLTIEGINIVIDSGLEKVAVYDESRLTNQLLQRNIAKSSATQRAGRAGRLSHGLCIRLYGEEEYQRRNLHNPLPITRADILPVVIEAARWGVSELAQLPLLDLPSKPQELLAWQTLEKLQVVDNKHRLTQHGEQVAKLPCHARFAHMIITAVALELQHQVSGLAWLACLLAALLEERDILSSQQRDAQADIALRLGILQSKPHEPRLKKIIQQTKRLANIAGVRYAQHLPNEYAGVLLFLAYPERFAKKRGDSVNNNGEYLASYGKGLYLASEDALNNHDYLVAVNVAVYQGKLAIRLAAKVDVQQLLDWQLITITKRDVCTYQPNKSRIISVTQQCIGEIVLTEQSTSAQENEQQLYQVWREQILAQGLAFLNWQVQDHALLARWRWINSCQDIDGFPDVSDSALLASLDLWLQPFIGGVLTKSQLGKLDISTMLLSMLDYQQQQLLDKLAPSYFIGPTGRKCPIRYSQQSAPIVSLPMQEVYGMQSSPCVGQGKQQTPLTIELLSPAQRPIQITADLAGFWQGSYKEVQKEMKAKYPKHYWPDDPANACATNKTKRHLKN